MRLAPRPGFTLVELLVTMVLVNVGLLALVGGSAVVVRRHSAVRTRSVATQLARARLELLATSACVAASGSAARTDGIVETWSAVPLANEIGELLDSVAYTADARRGSVVLRTRVAC